MVNWSRGALIYVHSAICKTYLVWWYAIDLWSIGGGVALAYVHSVICDSYSV